jgi:RNA-binding protein
MVVPNRVLLQCAAMVLTEQQKKCLRGLGHRLRPVITISNKGLSDAVLRELDASITHHELIKVKVHARDRRARDRIIEELCRDSSAELVTRIGNVALIFRRNTNQPRIALPAG